MLIENKSDCKWQRIVLRLTIYFWITSRWICLLQVSDNEYGPDFFYISYSLFSNEGIYMNIFIQNIRWWIWQNLALYLTICFLDKSEWTCLLNKSVSQCAQGVLYFIDTTCLYIMYIGWYCFSAHTPFTNLRKV